MQVVAYCKPGQVENKKPLGIAFCDIKAAKAISSKEIKEGISREVPYGNQRPAVSLSGSSEISERKRTDIPAPKRS
jgi:hypothetical protein